MKRLLLCVLMSGALIVPAEAVLAQGQEENRQPDKPTSAARVLTADDFVRLAAEHDTEFEQILIDQLTLKYQKGLRLPAKDIVLSVKQQHEFFLQQDRDAPDTQVSLSTLFPYTGTELTASYQAGSSISSAKKASEASFTISQAIAENAFGRGTRLLDKIVGLEVEVARHQIIEAYEDYLAVALIAYYTWYEDYENMLIGESSYRENLKLLENIEKRREQKIALPIDVNKVKVQVLAKKETLVELKEKYENSLNIIERMVRYKGDVALIPQEPPLYFVLTEDFKDAFASFEAGSRTFGVLRALEEKTTLEVAKDADDLLPSIKLLLGYEASAQGYDLSGHDDFLFAGISMDWPFPDQVGRAEYEVSKILADKSKLITTNTYYRLYTQLRNLYLQISREKELSGLAQEKITLARAVLQDEEENYSFGKVSLNDYIQAVNQLDTNRFSKISHDSRYKKLLIEWLRLLDRLVE